MKASYFHVLKEMLRTDFMIMRRSVWDKIIDLGNLGSHRYICINLSHARLRY